MSSPKVSIIVPIYNAEKYLQCCVDSLLNQTLKDIEIILVDDGSPDYCPAICDEYAKQDNRVRVIHKKNGGQGYARNSGLEIAAGEYIAFVDSDDYLEQNAYHKLYSIANDSKADAIYFSYRRFDEQGNTWIGTTNDKEIRYQTDEEIRGYMLNMIANNPNAKSERNVSCSQCCALYRNDVIKKYGIRFKSEREFYSEDRLFNLDYLLHSSNIVTIPDALYYYRVNPLSFTSTVKSDIIEKLYFYYQYLLEMLNANKFGVEGYSRTTRWFIGYSRNSIRRYVQSSLSKREKMQWLKEVVNNGFWKGIASSYPYRQLSLKYVLHFYLLHRGYWRLLYYYSKL